MPLATPSNPRDKPRPRLILGNWKMHGSRTRNAAWLDGLRAGLSIALPHTNALPCALQTAALHMGICVPCPYLSQIQTALADTPVRWGAQDVSVHPGGAHTGDVCASMLADFGVSWVLVGHSERRSQHGETSPQVASKALAALAHGMTPVVCLGETLAQQQTGLTDQIVTEQLAPVLDLGGQALARIIFAYEPVWAIGTGHSATPQQAQTVHATIRAQLARHGAAHCSILYGGSVKADNASDLLTMPDVDGALVGSASLDAEEFLRIAAAACTALSVSPLAASLD